MMTRLRRGQRLLGGEIGDWPESQHGLTLAGGQRAGGASVTWAVTAGHGSLGDVQCVHAGVSPPGTSVSLLLLPLHFRHVLDFFLVNWTLHFREGPGLSRGTESGHEVVTFASRVTRASQR